MQQISNLVRPRQWYVRLRPINKSSVATIKVFEVLSGVAVLSLYTNGGDGVGVTAREWPTGQGLTPR